ncbi:periplasmic binding protein-like II [Anaeromyces robustus]|uniref:Periplasmic binding protein-like II n=1 Tax=Anaeromyces robustus TaxID=1754192 RepID=A0A1Y1VSI2_9FUNG|nr:periplasmic binding protein-like II [Anaeromyces robustus]|eukprot:ORX64251.1 periplasmic binding protein-like II [Anaeromyces robustus]
MTIKGLLVFIFLFSLLDIGKTETIELVALTNIVNGGAEAYGSLVKEFNSYAEEKNLGIHVTTNLLTYENSTLEVTDYENSIESMLKKKSEKYDIIFYDRIFNYKFGPYLVDLKEYLPESHFKWYEPGIASETCVYDKKWVGLPMNIDLLVLYYNEELLRNYNKSVPKTWDELIETSKFIMEQEKTTNNSEIISYNPLLDDSEMGSCVLYEFIYTFREKVDSPYPGFDSKEATEALETLKKIKNEIASDDIFKNAVKYAYNNFFNKDDNNFLFINHWYMDSIKYKYTFSPGKNEGVSGTLTGGYNVGINSFISDEKKKASAKFVEYVTSKDTQKSLVMNDGIYSAIPELYEDKDVCNVFDCETFKNIQLVNRPAQVQDYSSISNGFRKTIFDYLYNGKEVSDTLEKVSEIMTSSYIKKSYYGLFIYFIIYFTFYIFFNL